MSDEQIKIQQSLIYAYLIKNKEITERLIVNAYNLYDLYVNAKRKQNYDLAGKLADEIQLAAKFAFLPFYPERIQIEPFFIKKNPLYKETYEDLYDICTNVKRNIYYNIFKEKALEINERNYDIIAITVAHSSNLYPALTLSRLLKEKTKAKVILGGILINTIANSFIKHPDMFGTFFDSLLTGYGEETIVKYALAVKDNVSFEDISGLIYKENNILKTNPVIQLKTNYHIALPSYDGINLNDYSGDKINIEFNKGCYWNKCSFCYSDIAQNRYMRTPVQAADMLKILQNQYKINSFGIVDNALDIGFLEAFADEILKRKLKISYSAYLRFEKELTYKLLQKLSSSGLNSIFFGLETASPRILKLFNKGINLNTVTRIIDDCYKIGIFIKLGIIYGIPTETEEELNMTINFIKNCGQKIYTVSYNPFILLKNSKIIKKNLSRNLKMKNIREFSAFSTYLLYEAPELSFEKISEIFRKNNLGKPIKEIIW